MCMSGSSCTSISDDDYFEFAETLRLPLAQMALPLADNGDYADAGLSNSPQLSQLDVRRMMLDLVNQLLGAW